MRHALPLIALPVLAPSAALAATGAAATSPGLPWFNDPLVAVALLVLLGWYLLGKARSRQDPDGPPQVAEHGPLSRWAFFAGLAVAALTLLSPLDPLGAQWFSVHMAQHLLLIIGAAPLLASADAPSTLAAAFPAAARREIARHGGSAIAAWSRTAEAAWLAMAAFAVTIWLWHLPTAHDWALDNVVVHAIEHLMVLATATLFWRVVLTAGQRRISVGLGAVMVWLISLQGALLSALIMFAPYPLCQAYAGNPLQDQVLAGLMMCIPASLFYLGTTVWALARLMGEGKRHAR